MNSRPNGFSLVALCNGLFVGAKALDWYTPNANHEAIGVSPSSSRCTSQRAHLDRQFHIAFCSLKHGAVQ